LSPREGSANSVLHARNTAGPDHILAEGTRVYRSTKDRLVIHLLVLVDLVTDKDYDQDDEQDAVPHVEDHVFVLGQDK
jgi:hypothetical protein